MKQQYYVRPHLFFYDRISRSSFMKWLEKMKRNTIRRCKNVSIGIVQLFPLWEIFKLKQARLTVKQMFSDKIKRFVEMILKEPWRNPEASKLYGENSMGWSSSIVRLICSPRGVRV